LKVVRLLNFDANCTEIRTRRCGTEIPHDGRPAEY